ncbi:Site-specific recombinase XerD [Reichenbachiella faecimaris]|uniref:Site-specific recombinase XerD n=1 Tax=Reichenbachiella faecimaris TaxID=692418 RepID=A0A1W2GMA0_REIFA|nr:site-specific integrase [Reichenbachiella faecimaris]SMD37711.1 Site-specific recombinase XerD [Reichenbachiella faecimaris]
MKVTLRQKKISKGMISLYLDFYPPLVDPETKKSTRREFLKLYLYEKPRGVLEKNHNKETKIQADSIRSSRQLDIQANRFDFIFKDTKQIDFLAFFKKLTGQRWKSDGNHGNWLSTYNYLERFTHGQCSTTDIDKAFCEDFKNYLQTTTSIKSESRKLSQNSQASYFSKFSVAVEEAFKKGYLKENYMLRVDAIRQKETEREFLTLEELRALFSTECEFPVLKVAAIFSALTGLRWSDLTNLTWGEIQYSEINGHFIRFIHEKTDRPQTLNIAQQAVDILGYPRNKEDKIFQGLKYSAWTNLKLSEWVMRAGITKKITFHCFRHTYATLQLSLGTDIYTVSKLLNHKNVKTTQIYAKVIDQRRKEAAERIPDLGPGDKGMRIA